MFFFCKRNSLDDSILLFTDRLLMRRGILQMSSTFFSVFKNPIYNLLNHRRDLFLKSLGLIIFFLASVFQSTFAQHTTSNNYSGSWEKPASWNPSWSSPITNVINNNITMQGYITANSSLSFSGSSKLTVKDTLVIKGNLTMNDNNDIKIEDHGIVIVWGNLTISYDTQIEANGFLIVTGDIIKVGDVNKGGLSSNDNPVKVFVAGSIPLGLTNDNFSYKALNCTAPNTTPYPNSTCSYGNMADLVNNPIYSFYQTTCSATTPTVIAGGPTTFCAGGNVTLTSSHGSTYLWSTGATTQSIIVSTSGSFTVKVTDASGCQSSASVPTIITVHALPAVPTITAGGPTTFCEGGNVTLSSSPGTVYLWSNGATNSSTNITSAGSYSVSVTNANGCQSLPSAATSIVVNPIPATPVITAGGATTFCDGGSVSLTSSAGTSYLWSNGATTRAISATVSGSYSVKVTNASGCQSAASAATSVTVNPLPATPVITTGGPTSFCVGGNVTLTSSAGATYLWSNGATTSSINISTSGSFTVRITSASGCLSAVSTALVVTVIALPPAPVITASGPTTFCAGGNVNLTSSTGSSYLWSNGATTKSINVASAGSFTVKVTNASGCQSVSSAATVITVNSLPVVNAGSNATIFNGTSTTLNATVTGTGPFTYSWSPLSQLVSATIEDPTTKNLTASTAFTLTAYSSATNCASTGSVTISISGGFLSSNPTATPSTVCAGSAVALNALPGGGFGSYSYSWSSVPSGFSSNLSKPVAHPGVTTIYSVSVFDGFFTKNASVTVTVNPVPSTPTITAGGPTTFCDGGNVTLTSSAGSSYLWSTGETTRDINVTASGSYSVIIANASGCQSSPSTTTIVTVNALPVTPTIIAGGPTSFCAGESATLTSSPATAYLWTNGATTPSINATSSGSYTVKVTNANGCQSAISTPTIITVNSLPPAPIISASGPTIFCSGGNVSLSSGAGSTYLWSDGSTTPGINVTASGSYTVRITNTNGCQSAASAATGVTVKAIPFTPTITAGGPATFCSGGSVTLTSSTGESYLWSNGVSAASVNITESGNYTVKITNAAGCQSAASTATIVTVNPLPIMPTITAAGPTVFCEGGNVTLTSGAGSNYLWSTGETSPVINATASGSYTLTVTNSNGCQSPASTATIVTVNAIPVSPVITTNGPTTFCEGGNVTLSLADEAEYLWSNGETTANIDVIASGSYSVIVTDINGCQSETSAVTSVTVNPLPKTPTITTDGTTTFCEGGSLNLTASAGSTYLWSNGAVMQSILVTTSGNYWVQVTNDKGCQSDTSAGTKVIVNPLPKTPAINAGGPTSFCIGVNVLLTSDAATNYSWSNGANTQSITVAATGLYSVKVTDDKGCESEPSAAASVTVNPLPAPPVISASGSTTFCDGSSVNLTASGGISYSWSSGENVAEITVTMEGIYTVTATDINGCSNSTGKTITVIVTSANAGTGGDACGSDFSLNATSNTGTGKWSVTSGAGNVTFMPDENSASAVAKVSEYGIYILTWEVVNQNCAASSDVSVVFHRVPVADAGKDQVLNYTFTSNMQAVLSSSETGTWSVLSGSGRFDDFHSQVSPVSDLKIGVNRFLWEVKSEGCSDSDTVSIEVIDLFVPQVITPNGDQKNDFFVIKGIENNGPAELIIVNRSGIEVYKNNNYENDWNGRSNNGTDLVNGTYFYILKLANQNVTKGYVVIKR